MSFTMTSRLSQKFLVAFSVVFFSLATWMFAPAAWAFNNPDLLPDYETPVVDLANFLPKAQEASLIEKLKNFETAIIEQATFNRI